MSIHRSLCLKTCSVVVLMLAACGSKDKSTDPTLQFYIEDVGPLITKQTLLFLEYDNAQPDTDGWVERLDEIEAVLSSVAVPQRFEASHLRWLRILDTQREGIARVSEAILLFSAPAANSSTVSRVRELNDQGQVLFLEARLLFDEIVVDINTSRGALQDPRSFGCCSA